MKYIIYIVSIGVIALSGCSPSKEITTSAPPSNSTPTITSYQTIEVPIATDTPAAIESVTGVLVTATPDLRLPPERWMEWPIVPTVSARAREIYQQGLLMGNNSAAFSKIGDCQSVPASFFGIYERPGEYSFSPDNSSLQEAIEHYNGSFGREGEAVRGGFNAATVLSPLWANTEVCLPGETPVECENRVQNPSIAFISLEVWFSGRTPDIYEKYMRRVIEYNISQGVLPILATKADNVEGDHSINYTIAKLAYEYDLPLWNFWLAVQPLPNHGLDPTDEIGFHLNLDGWNMRSFSALKVLDTVMRAVDGTTIEATTDIASTPDSSLDITFTPGPVAGLPFSDVESAAVALPSDSKLIFEISKRNGEQLTSAGVFQGTINGTDWQSIAEPDAELIDQSINGTLVAHNTNLYMLKDGERSLLTSDLLTTSSQSAIWLPNGQVAVILISDGQNQFMVIDPSGTSQTPLPNAGLSPVVLYPSLDPEHIYWGAGACNTTECDAQQILVSTIDGTDTQPLPYTGQPAFALDGKMAFVLQGTGNKNQLTLVSDSKSYNMPLFGNRLVDMAWSPDGNTLAVTTSLVSDYSGRTLESRIFFVTWPSVVDTVISVIDDVIEKVIWSPDGESMLVVHRQLKDGQYQLHFSILDVRRQFEMQTGGFRLNSSDYLFPYPIYWKP